MDSIYSRKRIRIPKTMNSKKNSKKIKFIIIITIAVLTFVITIQSINPVFETLCKDKAKSIATIICNEETTQIIKDYQYEDLVTIYKDTNENITMIKSNIITINLIISDVAEKIQKRIDNTTQEKVEITLGNFSGSKILASIGPTLPIKIRTVGNVKTDLKSEFKAEGINQTIHRIYLQIDCELNIVTPYNSVNENVSNQLLIAENIIIGEIPSTFYNLEGISQENLLDIVE